MQFPLRTHLSPPHLQEQHLNNNPSNRPKKIVQQQTRLIQGNSYGNMPGTSQQQRRFNPYNNGEQIKRFETSVNSGIFFYKIVINIILVIIRNTL